MRETRVHVSFRMFCFSMFPALHFRSRADESLHAHLALKSNKHHIIRFINHNKISINILITSSIIAVA
ncbi:hypothetical protein HanRHA438_Chr11g0486091 [Helianthus annuus]|nr:hypothetical protein HanRHA438_Chr11g0486091 [Helianthus annuus]